MQQQKRLMPVSVHVYSLCIGVCVCHCYCQLFCIFQIEFSLCNSIQQATAGYFISLWFTFVREVAEIVKLHNIHIFFMSVPYSDCSASGIKLIWLPTGLLLCWESRVKSRMNLIDCATHVSWREIWVVVQPTHTTEHTPLKVISRNIIILGNI